MSSKGRKSVTPWINCSLCESIFSHKDSEPHADNCPPSDRNWTHSYIKNQVLYSHLEEYKSTESSKKIPDRDLDRMVYLSQSAMQLCDIPIGGPTALILNENIVVQNAWPIKEKTLTSVSLTKNVMDLHELKGHLKIQKLPSDIHLAQEMFIEYGGKYELPEATELQVLLKTCNEGRIFTIGNKISVPHYGRKLTFKITEAKSNSNYTNEEICDEFQKLNLSDFPKDVKFFKTIFSTKWTIVGNKRKNKIKDKLGTANIGGYEDLIQEVQMFLNISLGNVEFFRNVTTGKGALLYGPSGVGKSQIAKVILEKLNVHVEKISVIELSNSPSQALTVLTSHFEKAKNSAPSIIFIDDIENLELRKSTIGNEAKIFAELSTIWDSLLDHRVCILATTSKIDDVPTFLRRSRRFQKEFEVRVPSPDIRKQIIRNILTSVKHDLTEEDVERVVADAHGYVAADLHNLFVEAMIHAVQKNRDLENMKIKMENVSYAIESLNPSAMSNVLVKVPSVKWDDIAGQEKLKKTLKQAVHWPLAHPEAFLRMGLTPPRGILMFGPPGCSKTMVAKALATESKLNFLSVSASSILSKYVGESEKAMRQVFQTARQVAPSIIFIDEIDALGTKRRSAGDDTGSGAQERVLTQLLTELDGVTALGNVTLVAATNRPDKIDDALLRPGRLDKIIYVPLPDDATRAQIFKIKFKKMPVDSDVEIEHLVERTKGFSGAEVQSICYDAATAALEDDMQAKVITMAHFLQVLENVKPRTSAKDIEFYESYVKSN